MTGWVNFLFDLGEALFLLGLVYGGYLVVRFRGAIDLDDTGERISTARRARAEMPPWESFGLYI